MNLRDLPLKLILTLERYRSRLEVDRIRRIKNVSIHSSFRPGSYIGFRIKQDVKRITVDSNVSCRRNCFFLVYQGATLFIGKGVSFNNHCSINCLDYVEIGENTIFGENVKIYDHNHSYTTNKELHVDKNKYNTGKISIGSNCWIGSNVTILKGVTIGNNVIIGAHCLVYKSIPSNSIVKYKQELLIEHS